MIITCPNCQTKYQVTYEAIGSAGRKVQCASCHQSWQQRPLPPAQPAADAESDKLFDDMAEDALDEAMQVEEKDSEKAGDKSGAAKEVADDTARKTQNKAGKAKANDAAEARKRQKALSRRQTAMVSRLPMARLRRYARIAGTTALVAILGSAYLWRVQIVERYPDLAGVYAAVGLGVNVVGLELTNLTSMRTLSEGKDALVVSAQIVGVMPKPVQVPPILVSLLDHSGHAVYEWSVAPRIRDLMVGERATFDTRLPLPPSEAVTVRLSFAGGRTLQSGNETAKGEGAPPAAHGEAGGHADAGGHGEPAPAHGEAPVAHEGTDTDHAAPAPDTPPADQHGSPASDSHAETPDAAHAAPVHH